MKTTALETSRRWGAHRGFRAGLFSTALVVTAALASPPSQAWAQAPATEASQKRALELFEEGRAAYREGRFADSVRVLTEAYGLVAEPVLLYNLARAHEGLGQFGEAIEAYERYLATAKEIPDRGAIETKLASLKRELADRERLARERDEALQRQGQGGGGGPSREPATDRSTPSPGGASPWPWVVVGLGGSVLVGASVLGVVALSTNTDADAAPSQLEAASLRDDAEGLATFSTVGFVVGGALLAIGATWATIDLSSGGDGEPSQASLGIGPTGATLRVSF